MKLPQFYFKSFYFTITNFIKLIISIVYDSGYGHTAKLAQAVAKGARQVDGAEVNIISVAESSSPWEMPEKSDAIISVLLLITVQLVQSLNCFLNSQQKQLGMNLNGAINCCRFH